MGTKKKKPSLVGEIIFLAIIAEYELERTNLMSGFSFIIYMAHERH